MQDLSSLAADSMWVTSQAAGNMTSSNDQAMTAPGSRPVDPLPDRSEQGDPKVTVPAAEKPGTEGSRVREGYTPSPRQWMKC